MKYLMNNRKLRMLNILSFLTIMVLSSIVTVLISFEGTINATAFVSRESEGFVLPGLGLVDFGEFRKAPVAISGNNIYIVWWTNSTGNDEVMLRMSTDAGQTIGDKINLSNTTVADSIDAEVAAEGNNVIVTWWERNQTSNEPVMRVSNDNGATFGPLLELASNGTLNSAEQIQ
jgi:hypothetical protein